MIDQAYCTINQLLVQSCYQQTLDFHAKTNNFPGIKPKVGLEEYTQSTGFQELERSDIPICPFDTPRIFLEPSEGMSPFPKRNPSANGFSDSVFPICDLMRFLQGAFGVERKEKSNHRPYPSGGALYPIQVILGIRTGRVVDDRDQPAPWTTGFYHYRPNLHALDLLKGTSDAGILNLLLKQRTMNAFSNFNFCIIYVGFLAKVMCKYGYRGYRLALLEVGSMYQQATLSAYSLGMTDRVWSDFADLEVNKAVGLNPVTYLPLMAQIFGYPHAAAI